MLALKSFSGSAKQIADELHLSTTDLRMQVRVAKHERRALQADRARSLREDGKTLDEIASILGYANDSSVRALLNENTAANKNKAQATAEILKKELAEKGAIDVGTGVERQLGVSTGVLQEALFILETEGYNRYGVGVPQVNDPKKRTITPVISVPEIDQREVYQNLDLVKSVGDYHSTDGGESWDKREYPASIDSSRVKILYGDEGGALKDGVIEIRRGVADLDLGDSHYAQVRILVDGTHYLKGMAMYSDDMPDGADIVFNTNKHTGTPKFTEKLTLSDTASENLKNTFKGLFAILDICKRAIGAILGPVGSLLGKVTGLGGGVLGVTGSIGEWLVKLDEAIKKNDAFGKGIEEISDFVSGAVTAIKNFAESVREYLGLPTLDEAKERAGQVKDAIVGLKDGISDAFSKIGGNTDVSKFAALIQALSIAAKKIGGGIFDVLGNGINKIITAVSNAAESSIY